MKGKKAKILLIDIETAPNRAYVWGMWKNNVGLNQLISTGYVLCWSAKWLDDDYIYSSGLPDYKKLYKEDPENDRQVVQDAWDMMNEADMIVAHNGKRFDVPVLNSRFAVHGFEPPASYKIIDTLQIAKRNFKFLSNRLDALGKFLGVGRKIDTGGFELWARVMRGDLKAWKQMQEYNDQDVLLMEDVYKKLRAWDKQHPNTALYGDLERPQCNVCGSDHVHKKGYDYTNVSIFHRFKCAECGHEMRTRHSIVDKDKRHNILSSSK